MANKEIQKSKIIKSSPVYYGWLVLFAATIGLIMTLPGQTVIVSVFIDKIIADLGQSRTKVSLMYALATLLGSFALPFVGRFIDKRGPRLSVIIISLLFALACVYMSFINGLVMLFIGFVLIRSLGQGSLALVSQHVINLWFIRRRGLTIGISGVGFAMGVAFLPSLIEIIINKYDWRMAYIILGLIVAATILPLGALLFRGHPESFGLEPDGANEKPNKALETNYTAAEARKTGVFWLFTAATITTSMLATGLLFHNYNILAENGLNRDLATKVFIPIGFLAAAANLITGYLLDKIAPRYVLSVAMMLLVSTLVVATQINSLTGIYIYGALLGTMQGTAGAISSTVFAHHFGRRHLGAIKGLVTTLSVAGSALGPVLFSFGYDMFSSYSKVILFSALLPLAIAIAAPFIKPVNQRPSS